MLLPNSPNLREVDDLDDIFEQLRVRAHAATRAAVVEIGGIVADELIQRLNTPYPPASQPDQDPHRRTGNLSAGIAHQLFDLGDGVTAMVTSGRDNGPDEVPIWLEFGTSKMAARGYMTRTVEKWEAEFQTEAARVIKVEMSL